LVREAWSRRGIRDETRPVTDDDANAMTDANDNDIEGLAAEYVLGSLRLAERRTVERRRRDDRALDAAVAAWERRLGALADGAPGVEPPAHVFEHIARRLWGGGGRSARVLSLHPARWRPVAIGAGALAAALALLLVGIWQALPVRPAALVAVLARGADMPTADESTEAKGPPGFVISIDPRSRTILATPVAARPVARRSYHLWLMPADGGAPVSLGSIAAASPTQLAWRPASAPGAFANATLAITLEPESGPPAAAPTGPILFTGKPVPAPG